MQYAQLDQNGGYSHQITSDAPIEWDANNYCTAQALVKDGLAAQFRVVELLETAPPAIDPATQSVIRDGGELVDGRWQYRWRIDQLSPAQQTANLERRRVQVSTAIDQQAKSLRDGVVALISAAEMASWPIKRDQALAFQASNNEADAPMLVDEAGWRRVTTAELADMVLEKAAQLAGLEARISGECGRRQDLLRVAGLAQIDALAGGVAYGWPGFPGPALPA